MDHLVEVDEQQKFAWGDLWALGRGLPRARSGSGDLAFLHIQPDMQHQEGTSVFNLICNRCTRIHSSFYLLPWIVTQCLVPILVTCLRSDWMNYTYMQERVQSTTLCIVEESRCRFLIWTPSHHSHLTPVSAPSVAQCWFLFLSFLALVSFLRFLSLIFFHLWVPD